MTRRRCCSEFTTSWCEGSYARQPSEYSALRTACDQLHLICDWCQTKGQLDPGHAIFEEEGGDDAGEAVPDFQRPGLRLAAGEIQAARELTPWSPHWLSCWVPMQLIPWFFFYVIMICRPEAMGGPLTPDQAFIAMWTGLQARPPTC